MGSQQMPAKTEEEKSIMQLLMEMKAENQTTALNHQSEFLGLKNLMVAQEVSLGQKIIESNENLKRMITENSNYFQAEINKINDKFEESEKRTERMIEAAIKAERTRLEKKEETDKSNLATRESDKTNLAAKVVIPELPLS